MEQKFGRNWIIRCCNIIAFLGSAKDGNFSYALGSTTFFFPLEIDLFMVNKTVKNLKKNAHTLFSISLKRDDRLKCLKITEN